MLCDIVPCGKDAYQKGMCSQHYKRVWKYGSPYVVYQGKPPVKDRVDYAGAHARAKRLWGSASLHPCVHCGEQAQDWAYDHTDPTALKEMTRPREGRKQAERDYSLWPEFYMPLCKSCHISFDYVR